MNNPSSPYAAGWDEGRFTDLAASFSKHISDYDGVERLQWYRGHRAGRAVREMLLGKVKEAS